MKPSVCMCCGEPFLGQEAGAPGNPNVCSACIGLVEDTQDNTIIESAIPLELDPSDETAPEPPAPSQTEVPSPAASERSVGKPGAI